MDYCSSISNYNCIKGKLKFFPSINYTSNPTFPKKCSSKTLPKSQSVQANLTKILTSSKVLKCFTSTPSTITSQNDAENTHIVKYKLKHESYLNLKLTLNFLCFKYDIPAPHLCKLYVGQLWLNIFETPQELQESNKPYLFTQCRYLNQQSVIFFIPTIRRRLSTHQQVKQLQRKLPLAPPPSLLLSGDIESNPGPKLTIGTFNARGCNNYDKLKRICASIFKLSRVDRFIFSVQETHIDTSKFSLVNTLWRSNLCISPSLNNARGVITFYSNLFDDSILEYACPKGRYTVLIGKYSSTIDLFFSVYAPNSGKNMEFYNAIFRKINRYKELYQVDNIYLLGDFNLVLNGGSTSNRLTSTYESKVRKSIMLKCESLNLDTLKHHNNAFTWSRSGRSSTLDYIIAPKAISNSSPKLKVVWGFDKSDHAAVIADIDLAIEKGNGMFRPNTSFIDNPELLDSFQIECIRSFRLANPSWDPHTKLEYFKVIIRSAIIECSLKHRNNLKDSHLCLSDELTRLYDIKKRIQVNKDSKLSNLFTVEDLDCDIFHLECLLHKVLEDKTKYAAASSRVKWLELGERSNKYFLNLNKSFGNKSFFRSFLVDGKEIEATQDKLDAVHKFYSELYSKRPTLDSSTFLDKLDIKHVDSNQDPLLANLTSEELLKTLKKCGDTAAGPDGISYKILKSIWYLYHQTLIESFNYGIKTGILAPSHREAVIILLEKKNKDKRIIQNLRPISLSNCDVKIITKVLTKRLNLYLQDVINPHQVAYLPSRQVHDNLRTFDLIREHCLSAGNNGYLASLDARKAFDSVDHKFIESVLDKFGLDKRFIELFRMLYNKIESRVLVNGFLTKSFKIQQGVKQGDALSCSLFIMCMEMVMNAIESDLTIKNVRISDLMVPKVYGYADDIAIIVQDISDLEKSISTYNAFSRVSGLFLNVDKTEIINLHSIEFNQPILLNCDNTTVTINTVQSVTICGKLFSNNHNLEYHSNVLNKIDKLELALVGWRKRPFSIFGRNLILKTYGLSQLTYMMQNTFFRPSECIKIEKICFNYLWNKKTDKSKAYERISRVKLKYSYCCGGINATDIESFDSALKLRQIIRSTQSDNKHIINDLQVQHLNFRTECLFQRNSSNLFINKAISNLSKLGKNMIKEILECGDLKLHKSYYNTIASEDLIDLINHNYPSPMAKQLAVSLKRSLGIVKVNHFINEIKFPSSDRHKSSVTFLSKMLGNLSTILINRDVLENDCSYRDGIFLETNRRLKMCQLTTKALKSCIFTINNHEPVPKKEFTFFKKIIHPKEREIEFFLLHDVLLTNKRLYEMKLVDSPECKICKNIQDSDHIFNSCPNSKTAWKVFKNHYKLLVNSKLKTNVRSLIKRLLFLNKDKAIHENVVIKAIENRIQDLNKLCDNSLKQKDLKNLKTFAMAS